ncbi:MAG: hypothetical protein ACKOJF_08605, partial [Planctomycetaceae bacterium]
MPAYLPGLFHRPGQERFATVCFARLATLLMAIGLAAGSAHAEPPALRLPGGEGLGRGQHIVFVTGEEYYRSEEGMSQFAHILSRRHGFRCTFLFATDPATGFINPNFNRNIPGLEALRDADLLVLFVRLRELPDEQLRHIADYINAGRPVLGIRNATHPFRFAPTSTSPYKSWD